MSREPPEEQPWLIDFFEEGETHENAVGRESSEQGAAGATAARGSRRGPLLEGRTRVRALALAVAGFLALVVVIVLALDGGSDAGADSAYLSRVAVPAQDSQSVGVSLDRLLGTAPSSTSALEASLRGLLSRQQQDLSTTAAITPPPRLRVEQQQAVSAMQFRVGALSGLLRGFKEAAARPKGVDWASQLSIQAERLIASDVIWKDFFVTPADVQIASDGERTVSAPPSTFVADANITAPEAMATVLAHVQRHAAPAAGQNAVLQLGDSSPAVKAWQQQLNVWIARQPGLTKLPLTGTFDQATQSATMALQTAEKITADGVVGPMTRSALATALAQG
jgi:hypothetical protein